MTKDELLLWMKSAKYVTTSFHEYDDRGNLWATYIYEKDGKLYQINYCNKEPNEYWDEEIINKNSSIKGGYVRGEYKPKEVTKVVKQITIDDIQYIPIYFNSETTKK